jgi:hypothetical protein
VNQESITNQTAQQINELCMADPFFISCVIQSESPERDLTTTKGVIETVNYEITYRKSEMTRTWEEYIPIALSRVNDKHAKSILLHLSKHADREWTPRQIKEALSLDLSELEVHEKLFQLADSDLIEEGTSNIDFHGLQDGTLNLILRNRFEKEISNFVPDLKQEFQEKINALRIDKRRLQGRVNHLEGQLLASNSLRPSVVSRLAGCRRERIQWAQKAHTTYQIAERGTLSCRFYQRSHKRMPGTLWVPQAALYAPFAVTERTCTRIIVDFYEFKTKLPSNIRVYPVNPCTNLSF